VRGGAELINARKAVRNDVEVAVPSAKMIGGRMYSRNVSVEKFSTTSRLGLSWNFRHTSPMSHPTMISITDSGLKGGGRT